MYLVVLVVWRPFGFLLVNLLELSRYSKSIIVTDPKGEIYRKTSIYFKKIGYVVKVLNLKDMKHSDRWNPLAENQNINDVQTSSDVIISNTQRHDKGGDEFWPRAEENLLKAFEFYFLETLSDKNNLTNVSMLGSKLEPGKTRSVTLYLTKILSKDSMGTFTNGAEILKTSNLMNLKDIDSVEGNKNKTEDDYSEAQVVISVKTGIVIYASIILVIMLLIVGMIILVKLNKIKFNKIKIL